MSFAVVPPARRHDPAGALPLPFRSGYDSDQGEDSMRRSLALISAIIVSGCGSPGITMTTQANVAMRGPSEPAPYLTPADYHISPDSRERLCQDTRLADRNNSFATLTKTSTSYYCF
jgi:hypothetical protein